MTVSASAEIVEPPPSRRRKKNRSVVDTIDLNALTGKAFSRLKNNHPPPPAASAAATAATRLPDPDLAVFATVEYRILSSRQRKGEIRQQESADRTDSR